jgi:DNA-directed RNA polymerase subunit N (RpoN/RPB10)
MIIPIRCFTCGKPIAHLWDQYQKKIQDEYLKKIKEDGLEENPPDSKVIFRTINEDLKKSTEGKILDDLKLKRQCCRRIMLTHVDLCKKI